MRTVWCSEPGRRQAPPLQTCEMGVRRAKTYGGRRNETEGRMLTVKKAAQATPNRQLKQERELRCWSQLEVADQIGTTTLNVSRWERGITFPTPHFRQELCTLFGKSAGELGLLLDETTGSHEPLSPYSPPPGHGA